MANALQVVVALAGAGFCLYPATNALAAPEESKSVPATESVQPNIPQQAPEEDETGGTTYWIETDFNSRYIYRGLPLSEGPVIQPSLTISRRGYSLGFWGNFNASKRGGVLAQPRRLDEFDVTFSKTIERGKYTFEPGLIAYFYPSEGTPASGEISLRMARRFRNWSLFINNAVDVAEYSGAYFGEIGASQEHEFNSRLSGEAKISLGVGSGKFNEVNIGTRKTALNLLAVNYSPSYAINDRFYLRPHIEWTRILDRDLRALVEKPNLLNIGLAAGAEF